MISVSYLCNFFAPFWRDKLKKDFKKKELKQYLERLDVTLEETFKTKYQNEVYYNALDNYITINKIFDKVLKNCFIKSENFNINNIVDNFIEDNPNFKAHKKSIENCIKNLNEIIFNELNNPEELAESNEDLRKLYNLMLKETQEVKNEMNQNHNTIIGNQNTMMENDNKILDGVSYIRDYIEKNKRVLIK